MNCEACTTARTHPLSGFYRAGCAECQARALAQSPQFFDAVAAEAITPGYEFLLGKAENRSTVFRSSAGIVVVEKKFDGSNRVFYSVVTAFRTARVNGYLIGRLE